MILVCLNVWIVVLGLLFLFEFKLMKLIWFVLSGLFLIEKGL